MLRILICVLSLAAPRLAAQTTELVAYLDGAQVVPPSGSTTTGFALVRITKPANTVDVFVHSDAAMVAVELRLGGKGQNGALVLALSPALNDTWVAQATVPAGTVTTLESGGAHLLASSSARPNGDMRGQVVPSRALRIIGFCNYLQVVPSTNSSATADWYCWLHEPENRIVYSGTTTLATSTARLMRGNAVQNGPLIANLKITGPNALGVTERLDPAFIADLQIGSAYIDHPTTLYPNGEIRGQLRLSAGDLVATANGAQVVPPTASTAQAVLSAELLVDTRVRLQWSGLPLTAGQSLVIRKAAAGQVGAVVTTISGPGSSGFTRALTSTEITDLRNGLWYASWLTNGTLYPDGEIRGQLTQIALPVPFGEAPRVVSGQRPVTSWQGRPIVGTTLRFLVLGGPTGQILPAALLLGTARLPQFPIDLAPIGMTGGAFLWHDLATSVPAILGVNGNGSIDAPIPFDLALRGGPVLASWVVPAPGTNPFGAVTTSALELRLQ